MTNLYELKMGAEKLEALKVLLENLKELEAAITRLNLEELKGIKSAFDDKYNTFDKFVSNLDVLKNELLSKVEAKGDRGEKGEQGERGPIGPAGPKGDRGETGQKGDRGDSFSVNAVGISSDLSKYANKEKGFSFLATDKGLLYIKISDASGDWSAPIAFGKGEKGDKGDTGPRGLQGERGPAGQQGAQGPRGERGETGPAGAQGPAGPKGDKGDPNPNAEDSQKLDGLDSSNFLQTSQASLVCQYAHQTHGQTLPDGDYSSSDFWLSITPGIYYAIRERGRNKPNDYGLVEIISNGEVSITWSYIGKVWKWYQDANKRNSGWKEVLTGSPTSLSSPNSIVSRDANGDFEARCISAASFKSTTNNDDDRMNFQSCIMYWSPDDRFMRPASLAKSREIIYGTDFVSVKNLNGYTNLPNKLIIQWGTALVASGDNTVPTLFPIAFPNRCLNITATHIGGAKSVNVIVFDGSVTQTGAVFKHSWTGGVSTNVSYLAIGY